MGIGSLGFGEMAIIFVIALIVFGPRKLPELGRSLGTAMREFRRSLNQIQRELEEADPVRTVRDETRSILGPERPEPPTSSTPETPPAPPAPPTEPDSESG